MRAVKVDRCFQYFSLSALVLGVTPSVVASHVNRQALANIVREEGGILSMILTIVSPTSISDGIFDKEARAFIISSSCSCGVGIFVHGVIFGCGGGGSTLVCSTMGRCQLTAVVGISVACLSTLWIGLNRGFGSQPQIPTNHPITGVEIIIAHNFTTI